MRDMNIIYCVIAVAGIISGFICKFCVSYFTLKISGENGISLRKLLLLKGRRSSNGTKAKIQYLELAIANGGLYIIVFMANGLNLQSCLYCLMTSAFLVISIVDFKTLIIPLECNIFVALLGVIMCIKESAKDIHNLFFYLIGACSVSIVLVILYYVSNGALIGGGDVKLMAAAGLLLGWKNVTLAFFLACIIGSVIHVIRMKVSKVDRVLAMGPYLCTGLWLCALWGDNMIHWYLNLLQH